MRSKFLFIIFLCGFSVVPGLASKIKYPVSNIPGKLLENSKAVIRERNVTLEVLSNDHAVLNMNCAITILNKNGLDLSALIVPYDKFSSIHKIKYKIYNEAGVLAKTKRSLYVMDFSAISGFSLYEDNRVKFIDPKFRTVPFTVEFSYQVRYKGLLEYPDWQLLEGYNISTQHSSFKVIMHKHKKIRYLVKNTSVKPDIENTKDINIYKWEASNIRAIKEEPYSQPYPDRFPVVFISPDEFEIEHYAGNAESWKSFGLWMNKLLEGQDKLNEDRKAEIRNLVANVPDTLEKVKTLYEYMQNRTRYVSIQVGIGGWQPFSASVVDNLGYGDCKALTNYMKTLLEIIGVKSNFTLVRAGRDAPFLMKEFPSNQFNHAILCVPVKHDTIWLECTDQNIPFGYTGEFTDDRDVLIMTESGGKVVHTRIYPAEENTRTGHFTIRLNNIDKANAILNTRYSGIFYDRMSRGLHIDQKDKRKFILNNLNLPGIRLNKFNYLEDKSLSPFIDQGLDLTFNKIGTRVGNRVILPLNPVFRETSLPAYMSNRKSDIFIRRGFIKKDTISYQIGKDFIIEKMPEASESISTVFGNYSYKVYSEDNKLNLIRTFTLNKGTYPAGKYDEFVKFLEEVNKLDNQKFTIKSRD